MERQNNPLPTNITALSLPKKIIEEEIVPRFPVKSLLRFRCVSKSWRSLISSRRFIRPYHKNSIQNPSFRQHRIMLQKEGQLPKQCSLQSLLSEEKELIYPSPLDVTSNNSLMPFEVVGCYNGLVCICKSRRKFYLWNPSTRISKKLPQIVCNRTSYVSNCGFSWDELSGEFKVFAFLNDCDSSYSGRVYSSKTKSWKTIELDFTYLSRCWGWAVVYIGGKLHWKEDYNGILFLDLKSEVFGRIEKPFEQDDRYYFQLGQIGGFLCLLDDYFERNVRVWVMKESWERLVDLSLDHELLQRPFSASSFTHKGSNGEIFVFDGPTRLVYHPPDKVFRILNDVDSSYHWKLVYVESLLSPEDV